MAGSGGDGRHRLVGPGAGGRGALDNHAGWGAGKGCVGSGEVGRGGRGAIARVLRGPEGVCREGRGYQRRPGIPPWEDAGGLLINNKDVS